MKNLKLIFATLFCCAGVVALIYALSLHIDKRQPRPVSTAVEPAEETPPAAVAAAPAPVPAQVPTAIQKSATPAEPAEQTKRDPIIQPDASTAAPTIDALENDPRLTGMVAPIAGATITLKDSHLPNQARAYRGGHHEGMDFYNSHVSAPVAYGSPAIAVKGAVVVRADVDYQEMDKAYRDKRLAEATAAKETPDDFLDELRGRTVTLKLADGAYARYCHLSGIPEGIAPGVSVAQGQVVGYIGNSGTSGGVIDSREQEVHLHFELWVDGHYAGEGLSSAAEVRQLWRTLFPPYLAKEKPSEVSP